MSAGEAATYIESGDLKGFAQGLADLLDDPERRASTGAIGVERIQGPLAWSHQSEKYVGVFDTLLHRPTAPAE
ncbi:MAG: hypothetical protein QOG52_543 [Frankiaceae bacterium]|nr:hypothetical protein [Frankiaceae bacterium]